MTISFWVYPFYHDFIYLTMISSLSINLWFYLFMHGFIYPSIVLFYLSIGLFIDMWFQQLMFGFFFILMVYQFIYILFYLCTFRVNLFIYNCFTYLSKILFINLSNIMSVPNYLCTRFVWGALVEDNGDHLNPGDTGNHISGG